jgi:hypothetical protein
MWCPPCGDQRWSFELLLYGAHADDWVFRRLPTLRVPLDKVITRTPEGIPFLTPEIQLLYKARHPRTKDQKDLEWHRPGWDRVRTWLLRRAVGDRSRTCLANDAAVMTVRDSRRA